MLRLTECPNCNSKVSPTDTACMDCGANLAEAAEKLKGDLRSQSLAGRTGRFDERRVAGGAAAGAGKPGERSENTRLKIFDKHSVSGITQEMVTSFITALAALVAGAVLVSMGRGRFSAGFQIPDLALFRSFDAFSNDRVMGLMFLGVGVGGGLIGIGQMIRGVLCALAIRDIRRDTRPTLVSLNLALQAGLVLVTIFCPPLGVVVAVFLRTSSDSDIQGFAQVLIYVGLAIIALLLINIGLHLGAGFRAATGLEEAK